MLEQEERTIRGVLGKSNDKTISSDIPKLSRTYYEAVSAEEGSVLPFYVLSRNYDKQSGDFDLFVGGEYEGNSLEWLTLPAGVYARIQVTPKLGFLWGAAIGEAKRFFYTKWLPNSLYQGLNLEYEYHTEKSKQKHPSIELIFGIRAKE